MQVINYMYVIELYICNIPLKINQYKITAHNKIIQHNGFKLIFLKITLTYGTKTIKYILEKKTLFTFREKWGINLMLRNM